MQGDEDSPRIDELRTIGGLQTRIARAGAGPDLLLLHGWGCSIDTWTVVWDGLAARHRVTAVDFPGFGQTERPHEPWGVPEYARWTGGLIESLGIAPCDVLAHSFGTRVVLILAAQQSDLFGKLVLTGACGARLNGDRQAKSYVYKALRRCADVVGRAYPAAGERWREALVQRFGSADYKALDPLMRQSFVRIVNKDLRATLPLVPHPTLLIWGSEDDAMPLEVGRIMEAEMPDAGLAVFEGAGHFAFLQQPGRFLRVCDAFI